MTNDQNTISIFRQLIFFLTLPSSFKLYVCCLASTNTRVGYLLLKRENSKIFITEVIESSFHKLGIGSHMIQFAIDNINLEESIVAKVFNFNEPSIRLHISNGFTLESNDEISSTYVYSKK